MPTPTHDVPVGGHQAGGDAGAARLPDGVLPHTTAAVRQALASTQVAPITETSVQRGGATSPGPRVDDVVHASARRGTRTGPSCPRWPARRSGAPPPGRPGRAGSCSARRCPRPSRPREPGPATATSPPRFTSTPQPRAAAMRRGRPVGGERLAGRPEVDMDAGGDGHRPRLRIEPDPPPPGAGSGRTVAPGRAVVDQRRSPGRSRARPGPSRWWGRRCRRSGPPRRRPRRAPRTAAGSPGRSAPAAARAGAARSRAGTGCRPVEGGQVLGQQGRARRRRVGVGHDHGGRGADGPHRADGRRRRDPVGSGRTSRLPRGGRGPRRGGGRGVVGDVVAWSRSSGRRWWPWTPSRRARGRRRRWSPSGPPCGRRRRWSRADVRWGVAAATSTPSPTAAAVAVTRWPPWPGGSHRARRPWTWAASFRCGVSVGVDHGCSFRVGGPAVGRSVRVVWGHPTGPGRSVTSTPPVSPL